MFKFGTWCTKLYKMSTKLWSSFLCWNCNWLGYLSPAPQIWMADRAWGKGVQNLGLDVQNCTKWEQNYDPVFYIETAFRWAACHQLPKFELPIAQEGMMYKIWDSMYKIVQNEYKIMIQFFMLKLHLGGGLHVTSPPNLNCR